MRAGPNSERRAVRRAPPLRPLRSCLAASFLGGGALLAQTPTNGVPALDTIPATNAIFVAFDLETTGLDARDHRVVEIAAVRFRGERILEITNWLVNPGVPIPENVRRIHGITDAMVAQAPPFRQVYPQFAAFAREEVLAAHNARFDVGFLNSECRREGLAAPDNRVLDTLKLSRATFPGLPSYTLAQVAAHLGLSTQNLHRATPDSEYAARIVQAAMGRLPANATVKDLLDASGGPLRFAKPAGTPPKP